MHTFTMTKMFSPLLFYCAAFLLSLSGVSHGFIATSRYQTKVSSSRVYLDGQGMAGGFFNKHMLGDVIRALQPESIAQSLGAIQGNAKGAKIVNLENMVDNAPSWEELSILLEKQQAATPDEGNFRALMKKGKVHSPLASVRLFGTDTEPRVTIYRDSAAWCPYCQKVWIVLEELEISYEIKRVDMNCYASGSKPAEFLQLQPSGNLPCAIFKDENEQVVLGESNEIIDMLDSMSTTKTMRPEGQEERIKSLCDDGKYNSLERKLFSEWMWYLTGKRKPVEYRERYTAQLNAVEEALSDTQGPYFLGKELSLPDILFIPFIERQAASLAYFKGFVLRDATRWPHLVRWLEAMELRPSYQATRSDYYTHSRALPPQLSAETPPFAKGECETMRDAIDALSLPSSDSGPTQEALDWVEPGWLLNDPGVAKREAADRLINNHENIVRFAARGAGTPGFPAAAASLADPRSTGNEEAEPALDVLLRHAIRAMLTGDGDNVTAIQEFADSLASSPGETLYALAECLDYLRLRIGVPRDMSYPAARELKKELLSIAKLLLDAASSTVTLVEQEQKEPGMIA